MGRSKGKEDLFVIFARPEQFKGSNHYYAADGTVTSDRRKAEKFYFHEDAKDFASRMGIDLTGTIPYIGRETFLKNEL